MSRRSVLVLAFLAGFAAPAVAADQPAPGTSSEAIGIARASRPGWRLGRLVARARERRPPRVEAEVMAGTTVVAHLRVDPSTGDFVPRGRHAASGRPAPGVTDLRPAVERALREIEIGDWAWPAEHGRAWGVPIRHRGHVVGVVKVETRSGRLLPAHDDENDDD